MEFKGLYLFGMRDQAPKMFMELRRSGKLDQFLQEKTTEAHKMLDEILARSEKDEDGEPTMRARREAEEIVRATLIAFASTDDPPGQGALRVDPPKIAPGETDDFGDCRSCSTQRAVQRFALASFDALARKIADQIQEIDASGIYGDDYQHKTLWDEYCHMIQGGFSELLDDAWEATVIPFLTAAVENIPDHEAVLLTICSGSDFGGTDFGRSIDITADLDLMQRRLETALRTMAAARDMSGFNDDGDFDEVSEEEYVDPEEER